MAQMNPEEAQKFDAENADLKKTKETCDAGEAGGVQPTGLCKHGMGLRHAGLANGGEQPQPGLRYCATVF